MRWIPLVVPTLECFFVVVSPTEPLEQFGTGSRMQCQLPVDVLFQSRSIWGDWAHPGEPFPEVDLSWKSPLMWGGKAVTDPNNSSTRCAGGIIFHRIWRAWEDSFMTHKSSYRDVKNLHVWFLVQSIINPLHFDIILHYACTNSSPVVRAFSSI